MKVKDIPSNELVTMTPELYQEFAQGGCVPACHLTHKWICLGDKFKLATVPHWKDEGSTYGFETTVDVMLAENSTVEAYNAKMKKQIDDKRAYKERMTEGRTGCFRINGVIVP